MTENNIYKDKKIDTKKAGFIRPARYFSNIQLSNSRKKTSTYKKASKTITVNIK